MRLSLDEIAANYQKNTVRPSLDEIAISYAKPQRRPSLDEIATNFEAEQNPVSPIRGAGEARMRLEEKSAVTVDDLKNAVGSVADHAKRAVTGTSAGLGNVGASLAYNAGWALDEYVNAVNSGANAVAKKVIGKPLISEEGVNPLSIAALKTGDYIGSLAEKTTELGLEGREPTIYDAIAQAIGSTAGFMIPGSAVAKAANLGKVGTAIAYGSAKGGLEAGTEGGNVWREQLRQVATPEEARSAARKDALLQLPLNVASDAVGSLVGGGGGIIRKMISRGLPEAIQETGQGVLSDKLSQRKEQGGKHETTQQELQRPRHAQARLQIVR